MMIILITFFFSFSIISIVLAYAFTLSLDISSAFLGLCFGFTISSFLTLLFAFNYATWKIEDIRDIPPT
ncbi:hypothetical protein [Candidatus Borrarchaeum sp.]|uniref:hypothetical protein n=1 Tax=Candidatus Borrarchaeum sp. TaxID=2846742 RepID=UPI00257DDC18|nr:hypothetical protein [Candidatus Borrarchaeum sp.]